MQAGKLRHRITIEAPGELQNEYGEPVEGWIPFVECYASREDLTGREAFLAQQVRAEVTTRFRMRFVAGITAMTRINDAGTIYNIESVTDPEGRGRTLILLASRVG